MKHPVVVVHGGGDEPIGKNMAVGAHHPPNPSPTTIAARCLRHCYVACGGLE